MRRHWTVLLALVLAACGDVPQPFRHSGDNVAVRPRAARAVVVVPPEGGGGPGSALAEAIVRALLEADSPASTRPLGGETAWLLAGRLEPQGGELLLHWRLSRGDLAPVEFSRRLPAAAWAAATPALIRGLAADLVPSLLPALAEDAAVAAPSAAPPPPRLRLQPPAGLPGDGDRALAEAMRRRLNGSGLILVEDGGDADLEASLRSAVLPQPAGDDLTLIWRVTDRAGQQLGQASQRGTVPHGRLDHAWGSLADDIAAGSVDGLFSILRGGGR